jgi:uncharacterized repeat protein (TIGR03943 family)
VRAIGLGLWSAVLLQSALSGRIDLLLRSAFHPLVWISGLVLMILAALELSGARSARARPIGRRQSWVLALSGAVAVAVLLVPPQPSFADLAANRDRDLLEEPGLNFVLPPGQRSLTDWVRLLRSQPDPSLHDGDPVRISGFVLPVPGDRPQLARLLVRCCLVDATPAGLPVIWPADSPNPEADQWLEVRGRMVTEAFEGQQRNVVKATAVRPIPRPDRPLEP